MADIYERQYESGVSWQDAPSKTTSLDAERLNKLDAAMRRVDAELSAALTYCWNRLGRPAELEE